MVAAARRQHRRAPVHRHQGARLQDADGARSAWRSTRRPTSSSSPTGAASGSSCSTSRSGNRSPTSTSATRSRRIRRPTSRRGELFFYNAAWSNNARKACAIVPLRRARHRRRRLRQRRHHADTLRTRSSRTTTSPPPTRYFWNGSFGDGNYTSVAFAAQTRDQLRGRRVRPHRGAGLEPGDARRRSQQPRHQRAGHQLPPAERGAGGARQPGRRSIRSRRPSCTSATGSSSRPPASTRRRCRA